MTDTTNRDYPYLTEGKWTYWYETGEKEREEHKEGFHERRVGPTTTWHKNGQMSSFFPLVGRENEKIWDENGTDITNKVFKDLLEADQRREKRDIQTTRQKRNNSLEGRNIPLTDDEKELGADFWSDIYGDDFIEEDP